MASQITHPIFILPVFAGICYCFGNVVYRLWYSPLSKVPGPKLAAISTCYEMYFDLIQESRFPWQLNKLHEQYGPIVRIGPNEVHINDPSYIDTHFSSSIKSNKYAPHQHQFGIPLSTFSTADADLHKMRRNALGPYFSRRSIMAIEPFLENKITEACENLRDFKEAGTPINLRTLFFSLTADIIVGYTLGLHSEYLGCMDPEDGPEDDPFSTEKHTGMRYFHWFKHLPWLWSLARGIRKTFLPVLLKIIPGLGVTASWDRENRHMVGGCLKRFDPMMSDTYAHRFIIPDLYYSDLPKHEKKYNQLWQEGAALMGAGKETVANTLVIAFYYLCLQPSTRSRLKQELEDYMLNANEFPSWAKLEKLPFLTAVIKETLRLGYGSSSRFIRVNPTASTEYGGLVFPPETAISMSAMLLCEHPDIYENPKEFWPERWLQDRNKSLELFVFGKGPRMCLGKNLAFAELYLTLATLVRRFDFELYETDFSDIEVVCDAFKPLPRKDSKGVRVMVSGTWVGDRGSEEDSGEEDTGTKIRERGLEESYVDVELP